MKSILAILVVFALCGCASDRVADLHVDAEVEVPELGVSVPLSYSFYSEACGYEVRRDWTNEVIFCSTDIDSLLSWINQDALKSAYVLMNVLPQLASARED